MIKNLIINIVASLIVKWFPDERPMDYDPYNRIERFGYIPKAGK